MKLLLPFILLFSLYLNAQTGKVIFSKVDQAYTLKSIYHSYIYSSPNEKDKTINRVNKYELSILEENGKWLKVKYHVNDTTLAYGYVKNTESHIERYSLGDGKTLNISPLSWTINNKIFTLSIKESKTNVIIDSMVFINPHHGEQVISISYQPGLKNVKKIIRFQTFRESCPGLTKNNYIIITENNKILPLISEISTGEIGWSSEAVYMPIQFGNGTIKLLFFDYEGNIIDYEEGELNELKTPDKYNIPLNELVIKKIEYGTPVIKDDDYIMDENDDYVINITSKTIVYRWNGNQLKEVGVK